MGIARRWDEMEYAAARTAREKEFLYWLTRCPGFGSVTVQNNVGNLMPGRNSWNPCGKNIITLEKKESGILRPWTRNIRRGSGISMTIPWACK